MDVTFREHESFYGSNNHTGIILAPPEVEHEGENEVGGSLNPILVPTPGGSLTFDRIPSQGGKKQFMMLMILIRETSRI